MRRAIVRRSRHIIPHMVTRTEPSWGFLTNHAQVLVCLAQDPGLRLRDIAERVHITERAVHRIVTELDAAGCITRERMGRRNHYTINTQFPIPDPIAGEQNVRALLTIREDERTSGPQAR
jgi:DNA-binding MarR family transcriptional regulator